MRYGQIEPTYGSGPQRSAGPGSQSYGSETGATGVFRSFPPAETDRPSWPAGGDQEGYGQQPGYGGVGYAQPPQADQGYGPADHGQFEYGQQPGYGQRTPGRHGLGSGGFGGEPAPGDPSGGYGVAGSRN